MERRHFMTRNFLVQVYRNEKWPWEQYAPSYWHKKTPPPAFFRHTESPIIWVNSGHPRYCWLQTNPAQWCNEPETRDGKFDNSQLLSQKGEMEQQQKAKIHHGYWLGRHTTCGRQPITLHSRKSSESVGHATPQVGGPRSPCAQWWDASRVPRRRTSDKARRPQNWPLNLLPVKSVARTRRSFPRVPHAIFLRNITWFVSFRFYVGITLF